MINSVLIVSLHSPLSLFQLFTTKLGPNQQSDTRDLPVRVVSAILLSLPKIRSGTVRL